MVWPLYLYCPWRACLTYKIGLTREMSISSIWVSMDNTLGWVPRSILFHFENQWPLISFLHQWKMCPVEDGWVTIPRYDSIQVVHVCIMDKVSICLRKFWVTCVSSWCWRLHIGKSVRDRCLLLFAVSLHLFSPSFCFAYLFLHCSFCWSLDVDGIVVSVSFYLFHLTFFLLTVVVWTICHWFL